MMMMMMIKISKEDDDVFCASGQCLIARANDLKKKRRGALQVYLRFTQVEHMNFE